MSENMKPCPACGGTKLTFAFGGNRVVCANWDCQLTGPRKKEREDAIAAWNALPRNLKRDPKEDD